MIAPRGVGRFGGDGAQLAGSQGRQKVAAVDCYTPIQAESESRFEETRAI